MFRYFKGLRIQAPAFEVAAELHRRAPHYDRIQLRNAARFLTRTDAARDRFSEVVKKGYTPLEAYAHIVMMMWIRMRYDLRFSEVDTQVDPVSITGATAKVAMDLIGKSPLEAYSDVIEMDFWLSPMGVWEPCGRIKEVYADVDREIFSADKFHGGDGSPVFNHISSALGLARMLSVVDKSGAALPQKEHVSLDGLQEGAMRDLHALQKKCFG